MKNFKNALKKADSIFGMHNAGVFSVWMIINIVVSGNIFARRMYRLVQQMPKSSIINAKSAMSANALSVTLTFEILAILIMAFVLLMIERLFASCIICLMQNSKKDKDK